jgi:predicted DNA-binding transcriptional regulator AlpA
VTVRRYSYLGPIIRPKGRPLSRDTILTLWHANQLLDWAKIARASSVSRSTLYRVIEGGYAHEPTAQAIERFADAWKRADDVAMAAMMARNTR